MNKSVPTLLGIIIILLVVLLVIGVYSLQFNKQMVQGKTVVGTGADKIIESVPLPDGGVEAPATSGKAAETDSPTGLPEAPPK